MAMKKKSSKVSKPSKTAAPKRPVTSEDKYTSKRCKACLKKNNGKCPDELTPKQEKEILGTKDEPKKPAFKSPWKKGDVRHSAISIQIMRKDDESVKRTVRICDINWVEVSDEEAVDLAKVIGEAVVEFFKNEITGR